MYVSTLIAMRAHSIASKPEECVHFIYTCFNTGGSTADVIAVVGKN